MTQSLLLEALSPLPPPARLGEVVGKYRLDRILATGGMGVVVVATHLHLEQHVAIKFMSPLLGEDEAATRRFMLEARSAARIRSEHVVRVLDVDMLPTGTPYIVMEYLEGEDLRAILQRRGPLPVPEAVEYVLQACEAIAEAHVTGIVHRDLKPGNLFCCRRPDGAPLVKVLDFGVSKLLPKAEAAFRARASTGPHVVVGTPLYASPEQLRSSREVDARTDIWALGVILYELVAGNPPFQGDTLSKLRAKVGHAPIKPLREVRPEVPAELSDVVARCLAKTPGERFQTVADLAEALAQFAPRSALLSVERVEKVVRAQQGARDAAPTLRSAPSDPPVGGPPPPLTAPRRVPRWRPVRFAIGAAAAMVTGGAIATWIALDGPREAVRGLPSAAAMVSHDPPTAEPAVAPPLAASVGNSTPEPRGPVPQAPAPPTPSAQPSVAPAVAPAAAAPPPRRHPAPRTAPGTSEFGGLL